MGASGTATDLKTSSDSDLSTSTLRRSRRIENLPVEFAGLAPKRNKKRLNLESTGIPSIPTAGTSTDQPAVDPVINHSTPDFSLGKSAELEGFENLADLFKDKNIENSQIEEGSNFVDMNKDELLDTPIYNKFAKLDSKGNVIHDSKSVAFTQDDQWLDSLLKKSDSPIFSNIKKFIFDKRFHNTTPNRVRIALAKALRNRFKNHLTLETLSMQL